MLVPVPMARAPVRMWMEPAPAERVALAPPLVMVMPVTLIARLPPLVIEATAPLFVPPRSVRLPVDVIDRSPLVVATPARLPVVVALPPVMLIEVPVILILPVP